MKLRRTRSDAIFKMFSYYRRFFKLRNTWAAIIWRACADRNETLTKKVFGERRNLDATKSKVNAWCTKRQVKPNQARSRWRLGVKSSVSTRRRARILTALFSDISALTEYIIKAYVFSEIIKEYYKRHLKQASKLQLQSTYYNSRHFTNAKQTVIHFVLLD